MNSNVVITAGCVLAAIAASGSLFAQSAKSDYPNRQIRMIVPFPPAGTSDIIARIVGQKLSEAWGQSVLPDSRPGAGGSLGTEIAAKTAPDGYTLLVGNAAPISTNPLLVKVQYDTLRDFAAISLVARAPQLIVVHPSVPVKTFPELIAYAKANGSKVNYGSSGVGTIAHLTAEMFKSMTGSEMVHITYKGMPLTINDLVAGTLQVVFSDMAPALSQVKAGKLRPIATTGARVTPLMPDVPTANEVLPGFEIVNWWGLFAPANTPKEIVARLNTEVVRTMQMSDVREKFATLGVEAVSTTPGELTAMVKSEIAAFSRLIKSANIRAE
ncbi:MAG: tripartite tricarboxylate transporter substrate binding protein [Proteobacteria bacterium]|nr:tripartite tricarboxylate transporter substrate binding protein [Burkholderiales bacterium]